MCRFFKCCRKLNPEAKAPITPQNSNISISVKTVHPGHKYTNTVVGIKEMLRAGPSA